MAATRRPKTATEAFTYDVIAMAVTIDLDIIITIHLALSWAPKREGNIQCQGLGRLETGTVTLAHVRVRVIVRMCEYAFVWVRGTRGEGREFVR